MEALATSLISISVATWVGAIVFQSAIVAPAVFAGLDAESARRFLRTLFPRFFLFGVVCGATMIVSVVALGLGSGWSGKSQAIAALGAVMLILQIVSLKMVPHINAARDGGDAAAIKFQNLHRLSVGLTVIVLLLGTSALVIVGASAASGLVS